jgi:RNA polymerase-binding transcription factor DksA
MAKTNKKPKAKAPKKSVAKTKPAAKPKTVKKSATKAVKTTVKSKAKAKPAAKKTAPKKVVAKKKVAPKKEVKVKKAAAKPVKAKAVEKVYEEEFVQKKFSTPASRKQEAMAIPKVAPQLHIFPVLTQRPIAHKPAKPAVESDKNRYGESELKEFETLINGKLDKAREEFRILKDTLNRTNDAGTDSTSGGNTKVLEDGAETAEKENLSQLAARQLKYMTNLENALVRIKNGTYGICSVTGKLIPKERLIAVPHTTQSIEAKMKQHD